MAYVVLTVWGVTLARVPSALLRMGTERIPLRSVPGLRFAKLLGTGDGRTFTLRDADPRHWGLLTVWESAERAEAFGHSGTHRRWNDIASERLEITMSPLSSRGRWARTEPFGSPSPRKMADDAQVASITRARLRPSRAMSFWRAVPPVSAELSTVSGLRLALGIGEAPIGLQGTFSLWESSSALKEFAYRRAGHVDVVRRTEPERWYTEELFARFEVHSVRGTLGSFRPGPVPGAPAPSADPDLRSSGRQEK
ncbi:monooxygenase [Kineosporia succinea]|uniref:Heme-degrading monooxygenase HmoA n=1 Tax=Kineosporia succinea TaxID=84632 RepID=A0ABT9P6H2_9ACTN|nr:monooxygenase [Kineosporia succinea]MDP9828282.1 heme-degrading monooxygenase HmoA [Kineosporia succinea]